jgi:hypothetical protein
MELRSRIHRSQRAAIDRIVARATAEPSLVRSSDGSVFIYEEHRDWQPPTTFRTKVTRSGEVVILPSLEYGP